MQIKTRPRIRRRKDLERIPFGSRVRVDQIDDEENRFFGYLDPKLGFGNEELWLIRRLRGSSSDIFIDIYQFNRNGKLIGYVDTRVIDEKNCLYELLNHRLRRIK